jgi:hypothetical protein
MSKKHISYFQSVITLGILSEGETREEASKRAEEKLKNPDGVNYCFFDQTPFEVVATEGWNPELEADEQTDGEGIIFNFNPSDKTKNVIATRLQKKAKDLTDEDYQGFVKECLQEALDISQV